MTEPKDAGADFDRQQQDHEQVAQAARQSAQVETLNRAREHGLEVAPEFRTLHAEILAELGDQHEVTLGAERGMILAEFLAVGAAETANRMHDLAERSSEFLGEDSIITRQALAGEATYTRYAGNPGWLDTYQARVDDAEKRHGKHSRLASMARMNLAVALNEWGLPDEDRQRSYRVANDEWQWRLATYGPNNPFVYTAKANELAVALRALQYRKPVMDPTRLQAAAADTYTQRARLLGAEHDSTRLSFVTLYSVLAELGDNNACWSLLAIVDVASASRVGPGLPERLPVALSRAFALAGCLDYARQWLADSRATLERVYGADAPRTVAAVAFLERSIVDNGG